MSKNNDEEQFIVPADPAIRKAIRAAVEDASAQMQMISDRKESLKDIAAMVEETYNVPKKVFNKMAKTFFKQSYNDILHEDTQFQVFYENVFDIDPNAAK